MNAIYEARAAHATVRAARGQAPMGGDTNTIHTIIENRVEPLALL